MVTCGCTEACVQAMKQIPSLFVDAVVGFGKMVTPMPNTEGMTAAEKQKAEEHSLLWLSPLTQFHTIFEGWHVEKEESEAKC